MDQILSKLKTAFHSLGFCGFLALGIAISLLLALFLGPVLQLWWFTFVPTGAMSPTLIPGDKLLISGLGLKANHPRRGEIVVFKTDNIPQLSANQLYIKRIAGLPGERIRITNGVILINEKLVTLTNTFGPLTNNLP